MPSVLHQVVQHNHQLQSLPYHYLRTMSHLQVLTPSSPLRQLLSHKTTHLLSLESFMKTQNIGPYFNMPLNQTFSTTMALLTGWASPQQILEVLQVVDHNIQSHIDESMITLSEHSLDQPELRRLLCQIRDSDYDLLESLCPGPPQSNASLLDQTDLAVKVMLKGLCKY